MLDVVLVFLSDITIAGSADDSAENTAKSSFDEQDTTRASRDRLKELPERLQEFTENSVEIKSTSS